VECARAEVGADLDVGAEQVADVDVGVVAQAVVLGVDDEMGRQAAQLVACRLDGAEVEARIVARKIMRFARVTVVWRIQSVNHDAPSDGPLFRICRCRVGRSRSIER